MNVSSKDNPMTDELIKQLTENLPWCYDDHEQLFRYVEPAVAEQAAKELLAARARIAELEAKLAAALIEHAEKVEGQDNA
jgi:hypothetical protein